MRQFEICEELVTPKSSRWSCGAKEVALLVVWLLSLLLLGLYLRGCNTQSTPSPTPSPAPAPVEASAAGAKAKKTLQKLKDNDADQDAIDAAQAKLDSLPPEQDDALLKDLADQIKELEAAKKKDDHGTKQSHDKLKAEIERLRAQVKGMESKPPPTNPKIEKEVKASLPLPKVPAKKKEKESGPEALRIELGMTDKKLRDKKAAIQGLEKKQDKQMAKLRTLFHAKNGWGSTKYNEVSDKVEDMTKNLEPLRQEQHKLEKKIVALQYELGMTVDDLEEEEEYQPPPPPPPPPLQVHGYDFVGKGYCEDGKRRQPKHYRLASQGHLWSHQVPPSEEGKKSPDCATQCDNDPQCIGYNSDTKSHNMCTWYTSCRDRRPPEGLPAGDKVSWWDNDRVYPSVKIVRADSQLSSSRCYRKKR